MARRHSLKALQLPPPLLWGDAKRDSFFFGTKKIMVCLLSVHHRGEE
jgi:hypothetical protein